MDYSHLVFKVDNIHDNIETYKKIGFNVIFESEDQALIQNKNVNILLRINDDNKIVFFDETLEKSYYFVDKSNNRIEINNKRIQKYNTLPNIVTMHYNCDVSTLFNTIVNPNGWDKWYTNGMTMNLIENGEIKVRWLSELFNEEICDEGIIHNIRKNEIFEFSWNKSQNIYKSRVKMKFYESQYNGSWINIEERNVVLTDEDMQVKLLCASGWGEMLTLAKFFIEKGITLEEK